MHRNTKNNRIKNTIKAFAAAGLVALAVGGEAQAAGGCNATHTGGGYGELGKRRVPELLLAAVRRGEPVQRPLTRTPQVENGSNGHR